MPPSCSRTAILGSPDLYVVRGFFFLPTDGERVVYGMDQPAKPRSSRQNEIGTEVWSAGKISASRTLSLPGETRATEYGTPVRMEGEWDSGLRWDPRKGEWKKWVTGH